MGLVGLSFENLADTEKGLFVFLGIFPLVNAGFDFLSYTLTLALMRFGFADPSPGSMRSLTSSVRRFCFFSLA